MGKLPNRFDRTNNNNNPNQYFVQKAAQKKAARLRAMCESLNEEAKTKAPESIAVVSGNNVASSSSKSNHVRVQKANIETNVRKALEELEKAVIRKNVSKEQENMLLEELECKEKELQELLIKRRVARFYILAYRINQLYENIVEICKEVSSDPMVTLAYCFLEAKDISRLIENAQVLVLDSRSVMCYHLCDELL